MELAKCLLVFCRHADDDRACTASTSKLQLGEKISIGLRQLEWKDSEGEGGFGGFSLQ